MLKEASLLTVRENEPLGVRKTGIEIPEYCPCLAMEPRGRCYQFACAALLKPGI
jgi:hypothetical protein